MYPFYENKLSYINSTWTDTDKPGLFGNTLVCTVSDDIQEFAPNTHKLIKLLQDKIILGIYDPLFELITNSKISGQCELNNGIPTGLFQTIRGLTIPRSGGCNREIVVEPIYLNGELVGYQPLVDESCSIGYYSCVLTDIEKQFYGRFIFTEYEPTIMVISDVIHNGITTEYDDVLITSFTI